MRRIILFNLVFLLCASTTFAKGVDEAHARQVAQNFYSQTTGNIYPLYLASFCANTDSTPLQPIQYAFNVGDNNGFVIVAGDDVVKPILGYSTTGVFSLAGAPSSFMYLYNKYAHEVTFARANFTTAGEEVSGLWNDYYNNVPVSQARSAPVEPLLTTTWDQDQYYNALCPGDLSSPNGFGGSVPTGCGATAMAQIMRYWSYPARGTGANSYNCAGFGTLFAYFDSTTYNWANMPNSVTGPDNDVATLMYDCGVAVNMQYNASESLSYLLVMDNPTASCQAAYTNYFGYDPSTLRGLQLIDYGQTYWINTIVSELNNGRPVQYAGQGSQGGHTWVLDGMDGNGNFHMNWGWGGTDNGYYSLDALDPNPSAGFIFNNDEEMIVGIQPANRAPDTSNLQLYSEVTVAPNPIAFAQTFSVNADIINDGSAAFSGYYCAALFDSTGTFIRYVGPVLYTDTTPLPAGDNYNGGLTFNDEAQSITVPGTYIIGIYYEPAGSSTWSLAGAENYANPIYVTIGGPTDIISLYSSINVSPATLVQGQAASVNVNLANIGNSTYYGQYEAVLLDLEGNFIQQLGTYKESDGLPANDAYSSPLVFNTDSIIAPEGQYILAIAENPSASSYWHYCGGQAYQNPILVDIENTDITASVNDISINRINIYPNPAHNIVTIGAGEMSGHYQLQIFNALGQQVNEQEGILNAQRLTSDVSGIAAGVYVLQLITETGALNGKLVVR